jgi:hypothetical protein
MKMSDRILPPGRRSSHHTGRAALWLGRFGGGGFARLIAAAELTLRVRGGFGGLTRRGERSIARGLLSGDLGRQQAIVDGVLEPMQAAFFVLWRIFRRWRVGHVLTLSQMQLSRLVGPAVWAMGRAAAPFLNSHEGPNSFLR